MVKTIQHKIINESDILQDDYNEFINIFHQVTDFFKNYETDIIILNDDKVDEKIRQFLGNYASRNYQSALALITQNNSNGKGIIIFPVSELIDISINTKTDSVISSLFEEFFHVQNYFNFYKHFGFLHYELYYENEYFNMLNQYSLKLIDEYLAIYNKVNLLSIKASYGKPIPDTIDNNFEDIKSHIKHLNSSTNLHGFIDQILHLVVFGIFDPLTRDAALSSFMGKSNWNYSCSKYYDTEIKNYWLDILTQMHIAFISFPHIIVSTEQISLVLEKFMLSIGINFTISDNRNNINLK